VETGVQTEEESEVEKVDKQIGTELVGEEEKGNKVEKEDRDEETEKDMNGKE
jgi:hypothetical protein